MPADLHQGFQVDPLDLPDDDVIFGSTAAMLEVRNRIESAVEGAFPILLQGESGTGKELVARFLHIRSSRRDGPFVKLSCAAIPQALLEGELFGNDEMPLEEAEDTRGLIEIASGGTLFLDEIAEMGWTVQRKLLHLLRDSRYFRVGGREERRSNVRIVCTTNVNLATAIKKGTIRRDLFNHLDVMCLRLSALRERKDDLPQLWDFFAQKLAGRFGRMAPGLTPEILHVLNHWNWPGNLRELENCIARVIILGNEAVISEELRRQAAQTNAADGQPERNRHSKSVSRHAAAEAMILQVLQANHWNQRKTTEELKRSYRSLLYRLRNAGVLQRPRSRRGFSRSE